MVDQIVISPVTTRRQRHQFERLPWTVYAGDENWVPPLVSQDRPLLGWPGFWGRHPFYERAQIVTFLATRVGKAVGRLAAIVNHVHNEKYNDRLGFFGFFESVNDVQVARYLFEAAAAWLTSQGMTAVRGPVNPSMNYTCGLLVDGFETAPAFLMTYNPAYYPELIQACGFEKSQDLYTYEMDPALLLELIKRCEPMIEGTLARGEVSIRRFDPSRFGQEMEHYIDIYNRGLDGTWGFTPLQQPEVRQIARDLRHVITPEFAAFVEHEGKPVGAVLAMLDYNQIIGKLDGRLLPFGFLKLLFGRRKITAARVMAMTLVPGYQKSGYALLLIDQLYKSAKHRGMKQWEFSWVLESNQNSRGTLERLGMKRTKTFRIFDKPL